MFLFKKIEYSHEGFDFTKYYDCIFSDVITERIDSLGWQVKSLTISVTESKKKNYRWVFILEKSATLLALESLGVKKNLSRLPNEMEYASTEGYISSFDECEREIAKVLGAVICHVIR